MITNARIREIAAQAVAGQELDDRGRFALQGRVENAIRQALEEDRGGRDWREGIERRALRTTPSTFQG